MVMEAAEMMTLGQAERYEMDLKRKLREVNDFICLTNNFYKTTTVHLRKKYNSDADDETVIEPKKNNMICKPMRVVDYMEDLLWELEKLAFAIGEAKVKMEAEFENPLFLQNDDSYGCRTDKNMYKMMQQALEKLVNFEEKPSERTSKLSEIKIPDFLKNSSKTNGTIPRPPVPPIPPRPFDGPRGNYQTSGEMRRDYKLNADGEQISYYYKVESKQEPEFDKAEVKAVLEKYQDKVKQLTDLKKQKEQEMQISYTVKYPAGNSLEEDLQIFLSEK